MVRNPVEAAQRAVDRVVRLWTTRDGDRTLDIRRLISPLRYDVVVRRNFLEKLRHWDGGFSALLDEARSDPYFLWFRHVECVRYFPDLLRDAELLGRAFDDRVAQAVETLQSYERVGFDPRRPVTVLTSEPDRGADSGAPVGQRWHIGDGCHRLALLLMDGRQLEPQMWRFRPATRPLLDNTAVLLRHLDVPPEEYARFVSHGFVDGECPDVQSLRSRVAHDCPHRLSELDSVIAVHSHVRQRVDEEPMDVTLNGAGRRRDRGFGRASTR